VVNGAQWLRHGRAARHVQQQSSGGGWLGLAVTVPPGGVLVVAGAGFQAAVQDADQPVAELVQRVLWLLLSLIGALLAEVDWLSAGQPVPASDRGILLTAWAMAH